MSWTRVMTKLIMTYKNTLLLLNTIRNRTPGLVLVLVTDVPTLVSLHVIV